LGDARLTSRLVQIAGRACDRGGTVATVFKRDREREGAYDFLENRRVDADAITASSVEATLDRIESSPFVVVPVDGTSMQVVDPKHCRDFGRIGSDDHGARGLKLVDALAVKPDGSVAGWLALTFWARPDLDSSLDARTDHERRKRPLEDRKRATGSRRPKRRALRSTSAAFAGGSRSIAKATTTTCSRRLMEPSTGGRCAETPTAPSSSKAGSAACCALSSLVGRWRSNTDSTSRRGLTVAHAEHGWSSASAPSFCACAIVAAGRSRDFR
jgi:hypothetical protein